MVAVTGSGRLGKWPVHCAGDARESADRYSQGDELRGWSYFRVRDSHIDTVGCKREPRGGYSVARTDPAVHGHCDRQREHSGDLVTDASGGYVGQRSVYRAGCHRESTNYNCKGYQCSEWNGLRHGHCDVDTSLASYCKSRRSELTPKSDATVHGHCDGQREYGGDLVGDAAGRNVAEWLVHGACLDRYPADFDRDRYQRGGWNYRWNRGRHINSHHRPVCADPGKRGRPGLHGWKWARVVGGLWLQRRNCFQHDPGSK